MQRTNFLPARQWQMALKDMEKAEKLGWKEKILELLYRCCLAYDEGLYQSPLFPQ